MNQNSSEKPKFPSGMLLIRDLIQALHIGDTEFFLAIRGKKSVDEFRIDGIRSVHMNQDPSKIYVDVQMWDDKKGQYEKAGGRLYALDTNLIPADNVEAFLFRRYAKARECAGFEFTGEGKAPPMLKPLYKKKVAEDTLNQPPNLSDNGIGNIIAIFGPNAFAPKQPDINPDVRFTLDFLRKKLRENTDPNAEPKSDSDDDTQQTIAEIARLIKKFGEGLSKPN
jgi:hypothetical protein